jgi:hypothetical protein
MCPHIHRRENIKTRAVKNFLKEQDVFFGEDIRQTVHYWRTRNNSTYDLLGIFIKFGIWVIYKIIVEQVLVIGTVISLEGAN